MSGYNEIELQGKKGSFFFFFWQVGKKGSCIYIERERGGGGGGRERIEVRNKWTYSVGGEYYY